MKLLPLFLLIPLALAARADEDEIAPEIVSAFDSFADAWRGSDAKAIGGMIEKDSKVSLQLTTSGTYSRDQAVSVLKDYFGSVTINSLKLVKDGIKGGSSPLATYEYKFTDANGNAVTAKLTVGLTKRKGEWVLSRVAVLGK